MMLNVAYLKTQIEKYNKFYIPRLKTFISEYEEKKSNIFEEIINEFDFIKNETVSFVGSGLPFFTINILNKRFTVHSGVKYLNKSDKIFSNENGLVEITFLNDLEKQVEKQNNIKKINLIDYSPLIKSTYHIIKEHFENLSIEYHNKNVNFEDIRDITKDSLIIIPYSEYLYILKDLQIFNKDQYVLVFNQKDDDEKRKVNTVLCVQDLIDQCNFSEIIFSKKYDICGTRMYAVLGKV